MKRDPTRTLPVTAGSPTFRSVDVGPFRVSDARFPPGSRLDPHIHDRTSFGVVLEGSLDVVLERGTHDCSSNSVETKPAGERHANRFGRAGARVVVIEPAADAGDVLQKAAPLLDAPHCFKDPWAAALAHGLAAELRAPDALAHLAVEGLVLELLAHCARCAARPADEADRARWLRDARDLLIAEFLQPIRTADVARRVGVHPAYLARQFRIAFGTTIAGYVRRLRVEWAARRLADPHASIATVALDAGFPDQSSLTRAFRAQLGVTPGQVRRGTRS